MRIGGITVNEILDSRGEKTIEVVIENGKQSYSTGLPSGKSKGKREATSLGAEHAKKVLEGGLKKELTLRDFGTISDLDKFLIEYDGTENKSKIGGDLSLGISVSLARALAGENGMELWEILREEFFGDVLRDDPPRVFSNMINGGAHADNNLDIQEYQIVGTLSGGVGQTADELVNLYKELGELLAKNYGSKNISLGDEEGYSLNFASNLEPLKILEEVLSKSGHKKEFTLGIDAAASSFYNSGLYDFEGKKLSAEDLGKTYEKYFKECNLLESVEDPFAEGDENGFKGIYKAYGKKKLLIGDDLTTTDVNRIEKFAKKLINGVIIKPNQIGTVTETCEAMTAARSTGIERIVSHRSGEVLDPFVIHFAKAAHAEGVKIGVPVKKERVSKFDELTKFYS